jgi:hypothetical protein
MTKEQRLQLQKSLNELDPKLIGAIYENKERYIDENDPDFVYYWPSCDRCGKEGGIDVDPYELSIKGLPGLFKVDLCAECLKHFDPDPELTS